MTRMFRGRRRGANAVEFGLTLPIFIGLTFGLIEFGWYFSVSARVNAGVLDGCRDGSLVNPRAGNPAAVAGTAMSTRLAALGLTCSSCTAALVTGDIARLECRAIVQHNGLTGSMVLPNYDVRTQASLEWQ